MSPTLCPIVDVKFIESPSDNEIFDVEQFISEEKAPGDVDMSYALQANVSVPPTDDILTSNLLSTLPLNVPDKFKSS